MPIPVSIGATSIGAVLISAVSIGTVSTDDATGADGAGAAGANDALGGDDGLVFGNFCINSPGVGICAVCASRMISISHAAAGLGA